MPPTSDPGRGTDAQLARRDKILASVARVAELVTEPRPWEEIVNDALLVLGEATRVSRVYIFDVVRGTNGERIVSQCFEWCAPGVTPQIDAPELQGLDLEEAGYSRWGRLMEAGQPVFGDVGEFPESERPLLEMQNIKSLLAMPIYVGARWWGLIGFDACDQTQSWSKVEVDVLHIAARALGATIQQQERESALRRAQKMEALGRMAGGIAHDFNNLLLVLTGELEMLKMSLEQCCQMDRERTESFALMEHSLRQACSFNRRLLEFSRSREGRPSLVQLSNVLRRAEPLLRQAAGGLVRTSFAAPANEPSVRLDAVQVEQVLLNLCVNAKDAMPHGGDLQFVLETTEGDDQIAQVDSVPRNHWVRLRVLDTGEGMPPGILDKIFEPFFTTKANDKGTGLGLSTTYNIVRSAGGHIGVSSIQGKGTEFRLYFPAQHKACAEPSCEVRSDVAQ